MHFRGSLRGSVVESLESRQLLSVSVSSKKQTLNVVGTSGADDISIRAHPSLINVIDVVIKNAAGREEKFVTVGRLHTINVQAGDGNDTISIDDGLAGFASQLSVWIDGGAGDDTVTGGSLPGTFALRDGNDRAIVKSSATVRVFGDAGNDRVEVSGSSTSVDGGVGNDTLVAGDGAHTLHGGDGDDNLRGTNHAGQLHGDDGDDSISITTSTATFWNTASSAVAYGDAGNDTITGSSSADVMHGGDGDDVLIGKGGTGDYLFGDAGDDVLDGHKTNSATLSGGDGDDDLYAGTNTVGNGEGGRDWFEKSDGWKSKDQDAADKPTGSTANTSYYGSGTLLTGVDVTGGTRAVGGTDLIFGTFAHPVGLRKLGDVGYVASDGGSASSIRKIGEFGDVTENFAHPSASLTLAERKGVKRGIVRLPAGWAVGDAHRVNKDFTWYDVTFGNGGGLALSAEFGNVYQVCVKTGSVIVSESAGYTSKTQEIVRAHTDVGAMWLPAGAIARIAGGTATYRVADVLLDTLAVTAPAGQRGLLVDGGVIWLAAGTAATRFAALTIA